MNWNKFAKEVHQVAVEHGWWERRPSFAEIAVMCHSELSEAVEEYRKGRPMLYCAEGIGSNAACSEEPCEGLACLQHFLDRKPEGVAVELADCILRILDTLGEDKWDIDAQIGFCPGHMDVLETIALCHYHISQAYIQTTMSHGTMAAAHARLLVCVETILDWARLNRVDMEAILRLKHEYNKTRTYLEAGCRAKRGVALPAQRSGRNQ